MKASMSTATTGGAAMTLFPGLPHRRGRGGLLDWRLKLTYVGFLLPAILLVVGLVAYPLVNSVVISMHSGTTFDIANSTFVGFDNYIRFFNDPAAAQITLNSFIRGIGGVLPSYVLGFVAALALNRVTRGMGALQVIVLIPFVISGPVAIGIWKLLLDPLTGVPATLGVNMGSLFTNEQLVWPTLLFMNAWGSFQFYTILLLAGLQRVPVELYEAAAVDGAGRWGQFRNVTFPALLPISAAICLLHFMSSFQDFALVYISTGGGPLNATQTLATYAYQIGFAGGYNVGYATAITFISALYMLLALGILAGLGWLIVKSVEHMRVRRLAKTLERSNRSASPSPLSMPSARLTVKPRRTRQPSPRRRRYKRFMIPVAALLFALFSSLPTLLLISRSLDNVAPGPGNVSILPKELTLQNWIDVLSNPTVWSGTTTAPPLVQNLVNSVIVVVCVTAISITLALFAGYALARWRSVLSSVFTGLLILTQMIPVIILIFPIYVLAAQFQLLNTVGQILATSTMFLPMAILFFRVYFAGMSREPEEAAAIDGAGPIRTFLTIALPNARTALGAMMAFALINSWNEFLFALTLVVDSNQRTFPPAIHQFTSGFEFLADTAPGGQAVYLLIPVIISAILLSLTIKQFTTAVSGGGTKG